MVQDHLRRLRGPVDVVWARVELRGRQQRDVVLERSDVGVELVQAMSFFRRQARVIVYLWDVNPGAGELAPCHSQHSLQLFYGRLFGLLSSVADSKGQDHVVDLHLR